jgi:thiol-disulfide isomerase/thioredoxin
MSKYMDTVAYLEPSDITPDSMSPHVGRGKPVVCMISGNFCGYCKQAAPLFVEFSKTTPEVVCATITIDGDKGDQAAANIAKAWSSQAGVPNFIGFNKQGKLVGAHTGGRDVASFRAFAQSLN